MGVRNPKISKKSMPSWSKQGIFNYLMFERSICVWHKIWHISRYSCPYIWSFYSWRTCGDRRIVTWSIILCHVMNAGASKKKTGKQRGVKHPTPVSRQNTPFCFQPKREKSMMSVARFNARSASSKVNHTPLSIYMENFGREFDGTSRVQSEFDDFTVQTPEIRFSCKNFGAGGGETAIWNATLTVNQCGMVGLLRNPRNQCPKCLVSNKGACVSENGGFLQRKNASVWTYLVDSSSLGGSS